MYDARRDAKSAGTEEDVGVCRCAKGVADNEESDILGVGVSQDCVTFRFDHVTVSEDELFLVQLFLFRKSKPRNGQFGDMTCQALFLNHEDACICFKVHAC
jgi:hypothetical protein